MEIETIISISAIAISLTALIATIWQAKITRTHNMLSVKPHLTSGNNLNQTANSIEYVLANNGLGPAIVTSFSAVIDDTHYNFESINHAEEVVQIFTKLGINLEGKQWAMKTHDNNSSIPAGSQEIILGFYNCLEDEASYRQLKHVPPRLNFHIKYKCMYGNEYEVNV